MNSYEVFLFFFLLLPACVSKDRLKTETDQSYKVGYADGLKLREDAMTGQENMWKLRVKAEQVKCDDAIKEIQEKKTQKKKK